MTFDNVEHLLALPCSLLPIRYVLSLAFNPDLRALPHGIGGCRRLQRLDLSQQPSVSLMAAAADAAGAMSSTVRNSNDPQWGAQDVRDVCDGGMLNRSFFASTDGSCAGGPTDGFRVPVGACVGPHALRRAMPA